MSEKERIPCTQFIPSSIAICAALLIWPSSAASVSLLHRIRALVNQKSGSGLISGCRCADLGACCEHVRSFIAHSIGLTTILKERPCSVTPRLIATTAMENLAVAAPSLTSMRKVWYHTLPRVTSDQQMRNSIILYTVSSCGEHPPVESIPPIPAPHGGDLRGTSSRVANCLEPTIMRSKKHSIPTSAMAAC
jgi:hypothetical protein